MTKKKSKKASTTKAEKPEVEVLEEIPEDKPEPEVKELTTISEHVSSIATLSEEEFATEVAKARLAVDRINRLVHELMEEDVDYGKMPGVAKPLLYQEGATNLCRFFRLVPEYVREIHYGDGTTSPHVAVVSDCLLHQGSLDGPVRGRAGGACSSWEKKYRYRKAQLVCPECKQPTIIKGKQEYGGGWVCWKTKGGCGKKYTDGNPAIEGQERGQVENPDPLEQFETILQMADKRALVMAVRRATGAGRLFTQDEEIIQAAQEQASARPAASQGNPQPEPTEGKTPPGKPTPTADEKRPEAQGGRSPQKPEQKQTLPSKPKWPKAEIEFLDAILEDTDEDGRPLFSEEDKNKAYDWLNSLQVVPGVRGKTGPAVLHKFRRFVVRMMHVHTERKGGPLPANPPPVLGSMAIDSLNVS